MFNHTAHVASSLDIFPTRCQEAATSSQSLRLSLRKVTAAHPLTLAQLHGAVDSHLTGFSKSFNRMMGGCCPVENGGVHLEKKTKKLKENTLGS
jgi:hypothetical protein